MIVKKINNIKYDIDELNSLLIQLESLIVELSNTKDTNRIIEVTNEINKLRDHYLTLYWCSYLGYLKNITDEKYLKSEELFGNIDPKYNNLVYKYYECLSSLRDNKELVKILGSRTFDLAHNQFVLKSDANNKLFAREKELLREYRRLILGTKFEFDGSEINLPQLSKYYKSVDRNLRKAAYDKKFEILISLNDKFNEIINELVNVRTEIAKNLNLENYKEYGFIKMNRIGYTEKDLTVFKNYVAKYIVPLQNKLREKQRERLNLEEIEYYDEGILFSDGNAHPKVDLSELIDVFKKFYKGINADIYNLLDSMFKNGLIDLENRENKSNGGLTTYLPDYGYPTFIKKYQGVEENITSITHEMGHSFQLFFSKNLKYHENRWPTFDICEIHSTANEFLTYLCMKDIFGEDIYKYFVRHLTSTLNVIVMMCAADDFQCKLYENPTMNIEERNNVWKEIYKRYYPTGNYNHEYYKMGIMWQSDSNRIDDPFYGIDYSLASICALSFYKKILTNPKEALEDYIGLCKDGGSLSLKELISKYNLCSPFDENDIRLLSEFVDKEIEEYTLKLTK